MACLTLATITSPTPADVFCERPMIRMHWIVRAPVLSPTCASLASSWALNLVVRRMTRLYNGWRASRWTDTTIVLSIRSLTTWPTFVLRLPFTRLMGGAPVIWSSRSGRPGPFGAPLELDGQDPGDRPAGGGNLAVVLELPGRQREARAPQLLLRLAEGFLQLGVRHRADLIDVHLTSPPSRLPG